MENYPKAELGILGGSGLYSLAGMSDAQRIQVGTPFGPPSDLLRVGVLEGRRVAFLARHGPDHLLLPTEINYRANLFAMKLLGVQRILSASAVGSLREEIRPRDVVLPDQFIDRTRQRVSTFFGDGVAVHVSFGDPICSEVRQVLLSSVRYAGGRAHDGGTYVCMEGPAFSTRAESELYRSWGVHVIGMTNLQEAKLAREAEICYATLALVTDYDCWHQEEDEVSVGGVVENLRANSELAARALRNAIQTLPRRGAGCGCGEALQNAIITSVAAIPRETRERLAPILGRYLS